MAVAHRIFPQPPNKTASGGISQASSSVPGPQHRFPAAGQRPRPGAGRSRSIDTATITLHRLHSTPNHDPIRPGHQYDSPPPATRGANPTQPHPIVIGPCPLGIPAAPHPENHNPVSITVPVEIAELTARSPAPVG